MGKIVRLKTKLKAVQAFNERGGTQLHNEDDSAAPDEPQDAPPASAQQLFSQPQRQNSGYDPPWCPTLSQTFGPPFQLNHFTVSQQYHQHTQYYNSNTPQQSSPPLQGWSTPNQQQQQQQCPPHHSTQPPQTPPNPAPHPGYTNNSYASSILSGHQSSISSTHSHQQYHNPPPPMTSSPPIMPALQRGWSMDNPSQTQDQFYQPPSVHRSQTMPVQYRPYTQVDHDCDRYKITYTGQCSICFP
ncbi:hypothetical protein IQ06DRAFT_93556 [Phaeosphaeriaceae sp. SRC1lsM3a]|nr:hypothetical protein IQ06DRAFT_93556 [Stagonospora sp. SRC1lsM3a]